MKSQDPHDLMWQEMPLRTADPFCFWSGLGMRLGCTVMILKVERHLNDTCLSSFKIMTFMQPCHYCSYSIISKLSETLSQSPTPRPAINEGRSACITYSDYSYTWAALHNLHKLGESDWVSVRTENSFNMITMLAIDTKQVSICHPILGPLHQIITYLLHQSLHVIYVDACCLYYLSMNKPWGLLFMTYCVW